ncbi:hypothetical protein JRO89_XS05G0003200 [Xanthoceras sorbifolium]|uniref:J domain-containing protein n=1 Tax=Xanthoceras sorbifolium TaxID=99658 RepID=A0ABQ8HZS8_9ROSI|nr:hypothetical protein JRO89_XS05G0003200 [Xanthoceras sorbifolium]
MATAFACLLHLKTPIASSSITTTPRTSNSKSAFARPNRITCKASNSSPSIDFDLYDLLGIDSNCDHSDIKTAYRKLQKKCHPDIAGPPGHDMSIILNEAYSLLSDPNSRSAYDREQAKIGELRGYTGKPTYSVWLGSENEERAVFVDEVKCVGCLKCALFAQNTFAIESVYGKARVVAQWADPENTIREAIQTCPVDCISIVERADLAALEFLMSKQPRGNVRLGTGNSNIFMEVKKFQTRYAHATNKTASKEKDANWESRNAAIQAIRSISNWLYYWQSPTASQSNQILTTQNSTDDPILKKLLAAAVARKQAIKTIHTISSNNNTCDDEYWFPSTQALPAASTQIINSTSQTASEIPRNTKNDDDKKHYKQLETDKRNPIAMAIPLVTAAIAAAIVRLQISQGGVVGELQEHVGGSLALDIVNSFWLQVILAGITWYFLGVTIVEIIQVIGNRKE